MIGNCLKLSCRELTSSARIEPGDSILPRRSFFSLCLYFIATEHGLVRRAFSVVQLFFRRYTLSSLVKSLISPQQPMENSSLSERFPRWTDMAKWEFGESSCFQNFLPRMRHGGTQIGCGTAASSVQVTVWWVGFPMENSASGLAVNTQLHIRSPNIIWIWFFFFLRSDPHFVWLNHFRVAQFHSGLFNESSSGTRGSQSTHWPSCAALPSCKKCVEVRGD